MEKMIPEIKALLEAAKDVRAVLDDYMGSGDTEPIVEEDEDLPDDIKAMQKITKAILAVEEWQKRVKVFEGPVNEWIDGYLYETKAYQKFMDDAIGVNSTQPVIIEIRKGGDDGK